MNTNLLLRQLCDIQAQADKIVGGENSPGAIENFARYSRELQDYILSHTDNEDFRACVREWPEIRYRRAQIRLWQLLVLPLWLVVLYKDHVQRAALVNEIGRARSHYARLEIMARQQIA